MGTSYDALFANAGVGLVTSVVIEGYPFIISDDPVAAYQAFQSSTVTSYSNMTDAIGGLSVNWDMDQKISPWKPFTEPSILGFSVAPARTASADATGAVQDSLGGTVFKRTGGTESNIVVDLTHTATGITVQRADDFAASGTLYAGPETITYSSRDTGTDVFTVTTRGAHSAHFTDTGARFSRSHKTVTASEYALQPIVGTEPRTWVGRWIAVWLHLRTGTDTADPPETDGSRAHLAFAGRITSVADADGVTTFTADDARRAIYETVLMRDPFRARLAVGYRLNIGDSFGVTTTRSSAGSSVDTVLDGTDLVVVSGAPASANEVQAGNYSPTELGEVLNRWLQAEKVAARVLFNIRYYATDEVGGGTRARLHYSDPTTTADLERHVEVTSIGSAAAALEASGWTGSGGTIYLNANDSTGQVGSPSPPAQFTSVGFNGSTSEIYAGLTLEDPQGTWVSQASTLPAPFQWPGALIDGVLKIGDYGYLRVGRISDTDFRWVVGGVASLFPIERLHMLNDLSVDDLRSIEVSQVVVMAGTFKNILLQVLFSTGTSGFNSATYGTLGEQLGCGIPYSVCGAGFVTDVTNLVSAGDQICTIIDKPTRFGELFEADFILRRCFFVWGLGRLNIKTWSTPSSTYASYTLTEATKATPAGTKDANRASMVEDDHFYNIVKIEYGIKPDGTYTDSLKVIDASSIRAHGERVFTIKARNTFGQGSPAPIHELLATFAGFFSYTSKPWLVIRRSIDFNRFESTMPGTVLALTDKYIRDPATGLRYSNLTATGGLSGFPGMVIGHRFDWGGTETGHDGEPTTRAAVGEVDIMLSPQRTQGTYVPCAQVDDTAAGSGYNAGTKTLTTYAHEHSEAAIDGNDNTYLGAGDEVLVVEMDPAVAASAQSWSDVIASTGTNTLTLTTGLAGFDTTKKYRVIYDAYATVGTDQKTKVYQADDADGLIVDAAQAYGLGFFGSSQSTTVTLSTAAEVPSRHSTLAYGDGKPLDVGYERDATRLANNLVNYKYGRQQPTMDSEVRNFVAAGGSVQHMIECAPIFLGMQTYTAGRTRLLSVAPRFRSTTGATATVRVTLGRRRPTGTTMYDVDRTQPYETVSFSTTSTTYVIPAAQNLDTKHCKLEDGLLGGVAWLYVELIAATEYTGMARCVLGALA